MSFDNNIEYSLKQKFLVCYYKSCVPSLFLHYDTSTLFQGTFVHIVPPIVLFLAKHELVPKFDLSSVHTFFTAAAPVGEEMMNTVLERFNNPSLGFRQG